MKSELHPCPFCGGDVLLDKSGKYKKFGEFKCPYCGALMIKEGEEASAIKELNMILGDCK